jgi:prepilin-type N-terminal cleavage/methylation domain-containing protein
MRSSGRLGESGFTLLEVLVALAILAVGVALTLSLISGALANIRKVQLRTRTIQHAETVMELALLDDAVRRPTTFHGDFEDGTRWSVQVDELQVPGAQPPNPMQPELPIKLFSYTVEVMAPDSRTADFRLQTTKIVNTQETALPMQMPR